MRWLLGKDLLILRRSRLLVALLIFYPVAIALLIGFAISASPAKPRVAVVDETPPGETITLGGTRVGLDEYTKQLFSQVDVVHVPTRAAAESKVASGEVLAAIVIPSDIVAKISSGVSQAQIEVIYNGDAVEQSFVRSTIDSTLAQANLALSEQIKSVAVHDLNLLLAGGHIGPLGSQELIGLRQLPATLHGIASRQPPGKDRATLTRIAGFASLAANNLGIAADVLTTVSQPITVHSKLLHGKRTPLDTYAVVVAVSISLMFLCVLLAAGGVALEREEHTIARLVRGLVSREGLLAEKAMLAAVCAFVVALAMLLGVSAFVSLDVSRIGLWVAGAGIRRARLRRPGRGDRRPGARGARCLPAGFPALAAARLPCACAKRIGRHGPLRRDRSRLVRVPIQGGVAGARRRGQRGVAVTRHFDRPPTRPHAAVRRAGSPGLAPR